MTIAVDLGRKATNKQRILQVLHRLEKYLNSDGFLEKSLKN